jgi:hypothetical protein
MAFQHSFIVYACVSYDIYVCMHIRAIVDIQLSDAIMCCVSEKTQDHWCHRWSD